MWRTKERPYDGGLPGAAKDEGWELHILSVSGMTGWLMRRLVTFMSGSCQEIGVQRPRPSRLMQECPGPSEMSLWDLKRWSMLREGAASPS